MRIAERNRPHGNRDDRDMAYRAEKHMLDDRGPFLLRIYSATGEYRYEIHAMQPAERPAGFPPCCGPRKA
jgi:hypothetical protein